ncbi:MAG: class IV adenylate cyclase [Bryobacteraceae bacterium]|nr:class IV adenylate cyclase [Bryobacteraceae bacterium]
MALSANHEIEIKLRIPSAQAGRNLLREAGFQVVADRVFETNMVFDFPDQRFRRERKLLRLRCAGGRSVLTYKGTPEEGPLKSREEIELEASDPRQAELLFERLGLQRVFVYEKYRTEYRRPGAGAIVMLDETPIGDFLEIEGTPEEIVSTAVQLGFSPDQYINSSYGTLYRNWCRELNLEPSNMTFNVHPDGPPERNTKA